MKSAKLWSLLFLMLAAGCNASSKTVPATPDGATSAVMNGLADDHPEVVWNALPDRYQKDVKGLISDFGNRMDKDVWDKSFAALNKVVRVAKDKRDFIFGLPFLSFGPLAEKKEEMSRNWDSVVGLMQTLTDSEIKTLDGVKSLDPESFLKGTVAKLSQHAKKLADLAPDKSVRMGLNQLKDAKVTLVKNEGDTATVRIESSGQPAHEEKMKKVDGKWLPTEVVDGWDQNIAKAKENIAQIQITAEQKTGVLDAIGAADKALDQLLAANSQEEFNAAAGGVMGLLTAFAPPGGGPPPGFDSLPAETSVESFEVAVPDESPEEMSEDEADEADELQAVPAADEEMPADDADESPEDSDESVDETTEAL